MLTRRSSACSDGATTRFDERVSLRVGGAASLQVRELERQRVQVGAHAVTAEEPRLHEHGAAPHERVEHGVALRAEALHEALRRERVQPRRVAVEPVNVRARRIVFARDVEGRREGGEQVFVASTELDATADVAERTALATLRRRPFLGFGFFGFAPSRTLAGRGEGGRWAPASPVARGPGLRPILGG